MVAYSFVVFAGLAAALPLNINLGAYSPALVVGDGEISFGGKTDVSNLINALEGAAVNAAAGANAGAAAAPAASPAPVAEAPAAAVVIETPQATPEVAVAAGTGVDPALSEQAAQITKLQGMGKQIAPRVGDASEVTKRDLAGFDRALTYAEAALTKGPKVQLGTGAEGSGVGIIVDNNQVAAARPGKGVEGTTSAAEKRDAPVAAPAHRAKVTTMYVKRGVPAPLQDSSEQLSTRELAMTAALAAVSKSVAKRADAIDEVNLNLDGDTGLTLTFVEEVDADESED